MSKFWSLYAVILMSFLTASTLLIPFASQASVGCELALRRQLPVITNAQSNIAATTAATNDLDAVIEFSKRPDRYTAHLTYVTIDEVSFLKSYANLLTFRTSSGQLQIPIREIWNGLEELLRILELDVQNKSLTYDKWISFNLKFSALLKISVTTFVDLHEYRVATSSALYDDSVVHDRSVWLVPTYESFRTEDYNRLVVYGLTPVELRVPELVSKGVNPFKADLNRFAGIKYYDEHEKLLIRSAFEKFKSLDEQKASWANIVLNYLLRMSSASYITSTLSFMISSDFPSYPMPSEFTPEVLQKFILEKQFGYGEFGITRASSDNVINSGFSTLIELLRQSKAETD